MSAAAISETAIERVEKAGMLMREIQRCEIELDALFFEKRALSIAPPPVYFFRGAPSPVAVDDGVIEAHRSSEPFSNPGNIGLNIRECRERAGFTQKQLADATGIRRPNIARLEKGTNLPNVGTLLRIAEALSTTITDLIAPDSTPRKAGSRP